MDRRFAYGLIGFGVGGALGWLALKDTSWASLGRALAELDWRVVPLALGAVIIAGILRAIRFRLLLRDERVTTSRLFLVASAGSAVNNLSPVRVLSEATQTVLLTRGDGVKASRVVSGFLLSRLFDLLVTVNLVGAGLAVLPQLSGFRPIVLPLWGLSGAALLGMVFLGRGVSRLGKVRWLKPLAETLQHVHATQSQRGLLALCISLTAIAWLLIGVAAWLVAQAAGIQMPFWLASIVIVAVSMFSGAVPAPPGVAGVYEFVAVSTLGLFAVDEAAVLSFAVVIHALLFLPHLAIGLPVLALERRALRGAPMLRRGAPSAAAR